MHLHVPHKPTWGVLLAITVVALPLGGIEFYRLFQMVSARSFPLIEGRIVAREETAVLTLPAARVTVQIKNSQQTVAAVMPHFTADTFSGTVRFHYSGDPRRLVHLEGEDNPLWLGLLLWAIPAVLWTVYFAFRRSPHWRAVLALD